MPPQERRAYLLVHYAHTRNSELAKGRRENWKEIIDRNVAMHVAKFPHMKAEIEQVYPYDCSV